MASNPTKFAAKTLLGVLSVLVLAVTASAETDTFTWQGGTDDSWYKQQNWNSQSGGVPGDDDHVYVNTSARVCNTEDGGAGAMNLYVASDDSTSGIVAVPTNAELFVQRELRLGKDGSSTSVATLNLSGDGLLRTGIDSLDGGVNIYTKGTVNH
ncbi:MAG: hypothetical protein JRJ18_17645 [Deltaproteobacteria bacterium]|nr:hypothetical protein [Deltaproteobacteria bacterium]